MNTRRDASSGPRTAGRLCPRWNGPFSPRAGTTDEGAIVEEHQACTREACFATRTCKVALAVFLAPWLAFSAQTASADLCDTLSVSLLCMSDCLAVNECINEGGGGCSNEMSELSKCKVAHPYGIGPPPLLVLPPSGVPTTPPPDQDEEAPEEDWDCGPLMATLEVAYDKCMHAADVSWGQCKENHARQGFDQIVWEAIFGNCQGRREAEERQCSEVRQDTYDTFPPSCPPLPDRD